MAILLTGGTYIDFETLNFADIDILVDGDKIYLNPEKQTIPEKTEIVNCKGLYITRSFVCGHHHIYSALARGMGAPAKNPENFYEILKYVWWTLDKCLDKDMIEASALVTASACALNGVSFIIDHHASPNAIEGSLSIIANAIEKVGLSHLLCYEITDRDGIEKAEKGLQETEEYLKKKQGLVGLHASFTVGQDTLNKAVALAEKFKSGIHIHVAEDKFDQEHCLSTYSQRVVERLNHAGALNFSKTILGHCLHLSDKEKEIIRNSKAWVVQNSESNLNNNVGFFNSVGMGDRIMLGTDGMHSDMLRSAKSAFYVGQPFDNITYNGIYRRFRAAHQYISENKMVGDGVNNLVVLDYDTPTDFNEQNFLGHFLFGWESKHVKHLISNGKLVVKERKLMNINFDEIRYISKELSKILWKKMK